MQRINPFLLLAALVAALAQEKPAAIGEIEFFGYARIDVDAVRAALPIHEGDTLKLSDEVIERTHTEIEKAVQRITGHDPTDVAPVCCDKEGRWMIYIGLAGNSSGSFSYNPAPAGSAQLPGDAVQLYQRAMNANMEAVRKGKAHEDDSKGYALAEDPPYRAIQLEMRKYALHNEAEIRRVLESSSDKEQRQAAAELLGYARQSKSQIDALVKATRDPDSTVRNNAIRALAVLAASSSKTAAEIPGEPFIPMLKSGSWTDRNKAGWLLDQLTANRDPKLLDALRSQALDALTEMARWRTGHAEIYQTILDRLAKK